MPSTCSFSQFVARRASRLSLPTTKHEQHTGIASFADPTNLARVLSAHLDYTVICGHAGDHTFRQRRWRTHGPTARLAGAQTVQRLLVFEIAAQRDASHSPSRDA